MKELKCALNALGQNPTEEDLYVMISQVGGQVHHHHAGAAYPKLTRPGTHTAKRPLHSHCLLAYIFALNAVFPRTL